MIYWIIRSSFSDISDILSSKIPSSVRHAIVISHKTIPIETTLSVHHVHDLYSAEKLIEELKHNYLLVVASPVTYRLSKLYVEYVKQGFKLSSEKTIMELANSLLNLHSYNNFNGSTKILQSYLILINFNEYYVKLFQNEISNNTNQTAANTIYDYINSKLCIYNYDNEQNSYLCDKYKRVSSVLMKPS